MLFFDKMQAWYGGPSFDFACKEKRAVNLPFLMTEQVWAWVKNLGLTRGLYILGHCKRFSS